MRCVVVIAALLTSGCAVLLYRPCADGLPRKVLVDPTCTRGICGTTCEPGRWQKPVCPE